MTFLGAWMKKGERVTCDGFLMFITCDGFLGLGGRWEKVSHVTVSGEEETGKGFTCDGFLGLERKGKRYHM